MSFKLSKRDHKNEVKHNDVSVAKNRLLAFFLKCVQVAKRNRDD